MNNFKNFLQTLGKNFMLWLKYKSVSINSSWLKVASSYGYPQIKFDSDEKIKERKYFLLNPSRAGVSKMLKAKRLIKVEILFSNLGLKFISASSPPKISFIFIFFFKQNFYYVFIGRRKKCNPISLAKI